MNTDFHTTSLYNESVTLTSRHDGLPLDVLIVCPKRPGILQLSHGMCEHKERYLPFMKYMALRGFACVIHDHRGHGKSVRNMSDLGYFYENGGPGLVKDLHQITRYAKKRFQGLPLFLFGHSMGSLAARVYLKYYERDLDGLIVCGSPSKPPFAGLGLAFVSMLAAVKGGQSRSRLMDKLFTVFDLPFRSEGRSHAWICTDKAVVEAFNGKPLLQFYLYLKRLSVPPCAPVPDLRKEGLASRKSRAFPSCLSQAQRIPAWAPKRGSTRQQVFWQQRATMLSPAACMKVCAMRSSTNRAAWRYLRMCQAFWKRY